MARVEVIFSDCWWLISRYGMVVVGFGTRDAKFYYHITGVPVIPTGMLPVNCRYLSSQHNSKAFGTPVIHTYTGIYPHFAGAGVVPVRIFCISIWYQSAVSSR